MAGPYLQKTMEDNAVIDKNNVVSTNIIVADLATSVTLLENNP